MTGRANRVLCFFYALRVLCAASMLSLGLSHQIVSAAPFAFNAHLDEQYRLPDGTFSVICEGNHGVNDDSSGHHADLTPRCEACILASSLLIPSSDDSSWLISSFSSLHNVQSYELAAAESHPTTRYRARAPPQL